MTFWIENYLYFESKQLNNLDILFINYKKKSSILFKIKKKNLNGMIIDKYDNILISQINICQKKFNTLFIVGIGSITDLK